MPILVWYQIPTSAIRSFIQRLHFKENQGDDENGNGDLTSSINSYTMWHPRQNFSSNTYTHTQTQTHMLHTKYYIDNEGNGNEQTLDRWVADVYAVETQFGKDPVSHLCVFVRLVLVSCSIVRFAYFIQIVCLCAVEWAVTCENVGEAARNEISCKYIDNIL